MTLTTNEKRQVETAILYTKLAKIPHQIRDTETGDWKMNNIWFHMVKRHLDLTLDYLDHEDIHRIYLDTVKTFNVMYKEKMDAAVEFGLQLP